MCHQPPSNKGWLRQLHPNVQQSAITRFELLVQQLQSTFGQDDAGLNRSRLCAFRLMRFYDVE